jgi:asparagine synthetase B (glutamine-hydrolysing)
MIESLLRLADLYWDEQAFRPPLDLQHPKAIETLAGIHGQFSVAQVLPGGEVALARDKLGINKLFLAIHESGRVVVSNALADLASCGAPIEATYSVPAGHVLRVDTARERLTLDRYFTLRAADADRPSPVDDLARTIRRKLDSWFSRLATAFGDRHLCVCLSGGLDSSVIAALAARHFPRVTAYSYGYCEAGRPLGEDVASAAKVAQFLHIPFRIVPATAADLLDVVDEAVCYGQDWRDFNVHCAVVNAILARAIAQDMRGGPGDPRPLVLSGDLMNEFLEDYSPVSYDGRHYYRLPKLAPGALRIALIRGLDAGDREVGVFNRYGLDLLQPYGLLVDEYLRLPGTFLATDRCKQTLAQAIAGDLLPPFVFDRRKARAQIGTADEPIGILPVLARANRDAAWLKAAFCRRFLVDDDSFLDRFVRLGMYRFPTEFPKRCGAAHGYLA